MRVSVGSLSGPQVPLQGGSAGSAMVGLEGMRLLSVSQVDGEVELAVETVAQDDACRRCGVLSVARARRVVYVRDLPIGGRPTVLVCVMRLWRCAEPAWATRTWSEACEHIAARSSWTERARRDACEDVGREASSISRGSRPGRSRGGSRYWDARGRRRTEALAYTTSGAAAIHAIVSEVLSARVGDGEADVQARLLAWRKEDLAHHNSGSPAGSVGRFRWLDGRVGVGSTHRG